MAQVRGWETMLGQSARLLEERTDAGLAEWNRRVRESGIDTEHELRRWLAERGVTGYAQMLLVMERFGYPSFLVATPEELIDEQYADRPDLRIVFGRVLTVASAIGADSGGEVTVQARKTYVSLVTPRRTFAIVRPTTRRRVDLGLRLAGRQPAGRLEAATSLGNDYITVRIGLHAVDDVDHEVAGWLQRAYEENA